MAPAPAGPLGQDLFGHPPPVALFLLDDPDKLFLQPFKQKDFEDENTHPHQLASMSWLSVGTQLTQPEQQNLSHFYEQ